MPRFLMLCGVVAVMLAACGGTVTITLPQVIVDNGTARAEPVRTATPAAPTHASRIPASKSQAKPAASRKPKVPAKKAPVFAADAQQPLGYERLFSPQPHAFRYSVKGEPTRRGTYSERFELRNGECGGSDCGNPWYRTEIRERVETIRARVGRDIWYGWSFYNATLSSAPPETALRVVLGQWKIGGDQPAVFRIIQTGLGEGNWTGCDPAVCNRSGDRSLDVVVDLDDMATANRWGKKQNFGQICKLFSLDANRWKWTDIVVNTNFGAAGNGYLRIWVNGELRCDYHGSLVSNAGAKGDGAGPSHRRGIFVSSTKGWAQHRGKAPKPTMVVFYDEFAVGGTRAEVDTQFRAANGQPPLD